MAILERPWRWIRAGQPSHIQPTTPAEQAIVIPLGDINGDGYADWISGVEDNVGSLRDLQIAGRFSDLAAVGRYDVQVGDVIPASYARVYFGGPDAIDGMMPGQTQPTRLMLPAPLLTDSLGLTRCHIASGDFNGDGVSDVAVSFAWNLGGKYFGPPLFVPQGIGTYLLWGFGPDHQDYDRWFGTVDVVAQAETYIDANGRVSSAGDYNNDGFDDLLIAIGDVEVLPTVVWPRRVLLFHGRDDDRWREVAGRRFMLDVDPSDPDAVELINSMIQNDTGLPGRVDGLWHIASDVMEPQNHAGLGSLYYGDDLTQTYETGGSASAGWLTLPEINLGGVQSASLSFSYLLYTDMGGGMARPNGDWARVLVSVDGGEYRLLDHDMLNSGNAVLVDAAVKAFNGRREFTGGIAAAGSLADWSNNWRRANMPLPADLMGHEVRLRLEFDTVDGLENGLTGWRVDDIVVRQTTLTADNADLTLTRDGTLNVTGLVDLDVRGIGDFNGDGFDDFAALERYAGAGRANRQARSCITDATRARLRDPQKARSRLACPHAWTRSSRRPTPTVDSRASPWDRAAT